MNNTRLSVLAMPSARTNCFGGLWWVQRHSPFGFPPGCKSPNKSYMDSSVNARTMARDHAPQLAALGDIAQALDESGIMFWLFGGWAIDFAIGRITRDHDDIDIVLLKEDLDRAVSCLCNLGYKISSTRHPHQVTLIRKSIRVQLDIVEIQVDGTIVSPGAFSDWPWHPSSLEGLQGSIGQLEIRIVSPQSMLETKRGFPMHPSGSPHREKDIHDISVLSDLLKDA